MGNANLRKAEKNKNDEFYTSMVDIENEMKHYIKHFKGKTIYFNCDDDKRNFHNYFIQNYHTFNLRGVKVASKTDFRSEGSIDYLKDSDIIITNPPFSLLREYIAQLMEYDKKFIIMVNFNAIAYKNIFPLLKNNKIWLGVNSGSMKFTTPSGETKSIYTCWFTNLQHDKRNEYINLSKKYNEVDYPKYDNYPAINVDRVKDIPVDYFDEMGVPITFLAKYNPEQFEIIGVGVGEGNFIPTRKYGQFRDAATGLPSSTKRDFVLYIKDKKGKYLTDENYIVRKVYARIIIKKIEGN